MIGRTNSSSMNSTTDVLDFTIVDGLTEPANPKEKMIWIATDEEITSWTFSATEPAAQQGLVWFLVGQSSSVAFSITKDNPIVVYPIKAQQYINNVWVEKTTKIYLNNEWTKWNNIVYYFKTGEGPTDIWNTATTNAGEVSITANKMTAVHPWFNNQYWSNTRISSKSKINLSNFQTLYFDAEASSDADNLTVTFGVTDSVTTGSTSITFSESIKLSAKKRTIWEVNVSNLSGEYYIAITGVGNNSTEFSVYNIYAS